jgi:hypothetical protein
MVLQTASRSENLHCAYCSQSLTLGATDDGAWAFYHSPEWDHPAYDQAIYTQRALLGKHLQRLFTEADLVYGDRIGNTPVDIVMLTETGGKLGVIIVRQEWSAGSVISSHKELIEHGIQPLWLQYAPYRLKGVSRLGRKNLQRPHYRVSYDATSTELAHVTDQIWYVNNEKLYLVCPHPDLDYTQVKNKIGNLESRIIQLPLSQLRMNQGLLSMYVAPDDSTPWGPLPKRFQ